ncbi:MAG: MBL fold metallo-hydrolase [Gammaproteobacteria bacterium]|nr:MBL fold metallo-hydrolase [Gammaproteobacteria bacterium]
MKRPVCYLTQLLLMLMFTGSTLAEDTYKDIEIVATRAGPGIYMLTGKGGNLGVSVGSDGVFLVDDQFAPLTGKIRAAIAALTDQPIRFVLNTHWHPDHTGGNENLGGAGSVIVAHDNVRKRLSVDNFIAMFNMQATATQKPGLPVISFSDSLTFHLNDNDILVRHVEHAHTDGDAVVWFRQANVIHTGDVCFSGMYPFIDTNSGGSIDGYIQAIDTVLSMANDKTVIIPGHGAITDSKELAVWRDMLKTVRNRIAAKIKGKATLEDVQASRPTAEFDERYGGGFINSETFVKMLYEDMTQGDG